MSRSPRAQGAVNKQGGAAHGDDDCRDQAPLRLERGAGGYPRPRVNETRQRIDKIKWLIQE